MAVLTGVLEDACAYFGGVPAELLFDQMKSVIIEDERSVGGKLLENAEFVRFAAHWGHHFGHDRTEQRACIAASP
jgi:transposase